jgi:hypothetical protein
VVKKKTAVKGPAFAKATAGMLTVRRGSGLGKEKIYHSFFADFRNKERTDDQSIDVYDLVKRSGTGSG